METLDKKENLFIKFFGDKTFLKVVIAVFLPILIQNAITNFVNLLDNIMVGKIGTEQMSGVAISNQVFFVFNLCIFGAVSGVGIFTAQYYGAKDYEGVRNTLRFALYACALLLVVAELLFPLADEQLISLFLHEGGGEGDIAATLEYGRQYLRIMTIGLPAFAVTSAYANTLRTTGHSTPPMVTGLIAVGVNLFLNYVLIYGHLGAPVLGVKGAAIATVVSRYVEATIIVAYSHISKKTAFFKEVYKTLRISLVNVKKFTMKGLPVMLNETLWSMGMTTLGQSKYIKHSIQFLPRGNHFDGGFGGYYNRQSTRREQT